MLINRSTEGVGFEPTEAFTSPVFKTGAINHSTTPPRRAAQGLRAKRIVPQLSRSFSGI
tara:strand:- start:3779 stop:3955 length:177 start_codon:yes stop_codon:yes gene_type:complete